MNILEYRNFNNSDTLVDAIENANRVGANLMFVHEALLYPYPFEGISLPKEYLSWSVNQKRIQLLSQYKIAVIRFHATLDEICIFDDFAKALKFPKPSIEEKGMVKLYDIEPVSVEEIIRNIQDNLNMDLIRVTCCNLKKKVRRIGLPWGGLGLKVED